MKTTDNMYDTPYGKKRESLIIEALNAHSVLPKIRAQRDTALAALRGMVAVFNVKDIDPLQAFVAIEQARAAIAATQGGAQ